MLLHEHDGGEAVAKYSDQPSQHGTEPVWQVRELLLLALAALLRAGAERVFTPGW
jgi:hypothetical protein